MLCDLDVWVNKLGTFQRIFYIINEELSMNNVTLLSVNVPSTNISDKIIQFRPMCREATHWPNAFDESFVECIDILLIIRRMHSANVFFGPMCLERKKLFAMLLLENIISRTFLV